jgi:hypothetical protein
MLYTGAMTIEKIALGYWYQRTDLHLSEIYDFLRGGTSPLELSERKLGELWEALEISEAKLEIDILERVVFSAPGGISGRIYEDGLVLLTKDPEETPEDIMQLTAYFEEKFSPAITYLFSLGAPVPKELAGIRTVFPYFVVTSGAKKGEVTKFLAGLNEEEYFEIKSGKVDIYRGDQYYVVNTGEGFTDAEGLIEMLIFFKEFKTQLHHYLNLHRSIWEKIEKIKEQRFVRGRQVQEFRNQLESYKKTIELIDGRINQMGLYMGSRRSIIEQNGWEKTLGDILEFRYENLAHTHEYIKSIWAMTRGYVDSAIQIFSEVNALSTRSSVEALTLITSIGVVSGIIAYLGTEQWPSLTTTGAFYLIGLITVTWLLNRLLGFFFARVRYRITDVKLAKNLR